MLEAAHEVPAAAGHAVTVEMYTKAAATLVDVQEIDRKNTLYVLFAAKCNITVPGNETATERAEGDNREARRVIGGRLLDSLAVTIVLAFESIPNRFDGVKFLSGSFGVKSEETRQ